MTVATGAFFRRGLRRDASAPVIVAFHGDGADERQGLGIGRAIWPGAPIIAPRGRWPSSLGWQYLDDARQGWAGEMAMLQDLAHSTANAVGEREMPLVERVLVGIGGGADAALAMVCGCTHDISAAVLLAPCRVPPSWRRDLHGLESLVLAEAGQRRSAEEAAATLRACRATVSLLDVPERATMQTFAKVAGPWLQQHLRGIVDEDA